MVLDIKKAQAQAAKLFPDATKIGKPSTARVSNKVTSSAQAAQNAAVLFPDSTKGSVGTLKVTPLGGSSEKPQNQEDIETVTATGGTRTYTVNGQTTGAVAYNASAATIQAALEALSTVANEDVSTSGAAGGIYTLTFGGAFANVDMVITTTPSLTGGVNTAAVTHPSSGVYVITLGAGNSGGGFTITVNGQTTGSIAYNATGATVQTALEALSNVGAVSVDVAVTQTGTYVNTFNWGGAMANTMVDFKVDPASLTGGGATVRRSVDAFTGLQAREATQNALAAMGLKRSPSQVSNDVEFWGRRKPVDIGQEGRIAGEDYGKLA